MVHQLPKSSWSSKMVATFNHEHCRKFGKKNGQTKIVIVSPAFLADGLETLEELDIEIREHFIDHGGHELTVINCLNDDPGWIDGLTHLVENAFSNSLTTN